MSDTALEAVAAGLEELGPLVTFPWHRQQQLALASASDTTVILGGTQSGKTQSGLGIVSRLVRREGPIYRRLVDADRRPLKLWVAPKTGEKAESVWELALRDFVFAGLEFSYVSSPHRVFTWVDSVSRENTLWLKSQDQGLLAFESDKVDLVLFDEEPLDRRLYGAARGRLTTTNGVIVFTFTPLHGMSWTHSAFYLPCVRPQFQRAPRFWRQGSKLTVVQMGMADNPASVAGGGVQRLLDDTTITEAERQTRLYGEYGFTEGLLFPALAGLYAENRDSVYLLDGLPPDRPYSWFLLCDPNKRHGALLVAQDHEGLAYVVAEHYAEGLPDTAHAASYRELFERLKLDDSAVSCFADPGGAGAQSILNLAELGIMCGAVPKGPGSVKASIELVRRALWVNPKRRHPGTGELGAPALFFIRSLKSQWSDEGVAHIESRLFYELRQYRQEEGAPPDTPVKEQDDCVDPLRYFYLIRPQPPDAAAAKWGAETAEPPERDRLSELADDDFDRLAARAIKRSVPRPRRKP